MSFSRTLLAGAFLLLGGAVFAAEDAAKVRQAPMPDWITSADETRVPSAGAASAGLEYLLIDSQTRVADQADFNHLTYRITSVAGLQQASQITVSFDPDYQSLDYHFVRVIRDGRTNDRFNPSALKVFQQERELDRHMYNGRLTSLLILDDVRVGDIVDYAFTRRGFNPIFGGRYFDNFSIAWSVPVHRQRYRLIMPNRRAVAGTTFGADRVSFTVSPGADSTEYLWNREDLEPVSVDSELPSWYPPYAFHEITEFKSWHEVSEWARPLYDLAGAQTPELRAKAEEQTRSQRTAEAKVLALLDFVQRDVRYLGMELGPGSHRPNLPAAVLAQRFGDCKDKTRLFCALLQDIGIEGTPALVHSELRNSLIRWMPSPYAFDHVIARVRLGDRFYWLDPTRSYQRGTLQNRSVIDLGFALVLAPDTTELAAIPAESAAAPRIQKDEELAVPRFDAPATLDVTTRYSGESAEGLRAYLAQTSAGDYARDLLNRYAQLYPSIVARTPPHWEDQENLNEITLWESYEIPRLWKQNTVTGKDEFELFPLSLRPFVQRPASPRRSAPLAVSYPSNLEINIHATLPIPWTVQARKEQVRNEAFSFEMSKGATGNSVELNYKWTSLRDSVPVEKVDTYIADLDRARDLLGITLTHLVFRPHTSIWPTVSDQVAEPPTGFDWNWPMMMMTFGVLGGGLYASLRIHRNPPGLEAPPLAATDEPSGLGGWLALVGLGLVVRPLLVVRTFSNQLPALFDQRHWVTATTPGLSTYHALAAPLYLLETVGNTLFLVFSVLALALFFQKRRQFRPVIVWLLAGAAVLSVVTGWIRYQIPWTGRDLQEIIRSVAAAVIGIPYFLISKRVKNTFVN